MTELVACVNRQVARIFRETKSGEQAKEIGEGVEQRELEELEKEFYSRFPPREGSHNPREDECDPLMYALYRFLLAHATRRMTCAIVDAQKPLIQFAKTERF